jgi:1-deoxy-D-xylulose-5-phosphate reductoisomerase
MARAPAHALHSRRPPLVPGLLSPRHEKLQSKSTLESAVCSLAILGSTGSIGRSAVELAKRFPDRIKVHALCGHSNIELLAEQARELGPSVVASTDSGRIAELKAALGSEVLRSTRVLGGCEAASEIAALPEVTCVLAAIMGSAGLPSVLSALSQGKRVALANKESLVAGGELVAGALEAGGGEIIPVDSEHAALFQALQGTTLSEVSRLILTASGGPFLRRDVKTLGSVTPEEATRHPRWNMGAKISIDSATLVNKALELIEAHWLFGFPENEISVLVHPESIVHCLIEMVDGSQLAQLSVSDMTGPIAAALTYPKRVAGVLKPLVLSEVGALHFEALSSGKFSAVELARECLRAGGAATAVFNAANEAAVARFMERTLAFDRIVPLAESALKAFQGAAIHDLQDLQRLERDVREMARSLS